jgi:hypothetical protein
MTADTVFLKNKGLVGVLYQFLILRVEVLSQSIDIFVLIYTTINEHQGTKTACPKTAPNYHPTTFILSGFDYMAFLISLSNFSEYALTSIATVNGVA